MAHTGNEKRKDPRVSGRFVVSYRILEEANNVDISQTRNISVGGMLLTTNRGFDKGTNLALEIRLPFSLDAMKFIGRVVESREISRGLIYDTRIEFFSVEDKYKKVVGDTVDYYLKKGHK
ncbi:MAG: PilZ domain-containing protein [Candidatus Omnitrophica bacterium]|nr:PilZ domain-containing protein [Candidatus Omnitrophota bacterium]